MKNKKGSMELGINAIVVLIIALALLGLGIGFVTKLFSASQDKMVRIIDRAELPIHADSMNQMLFDTSTLEVKAGKASPLLVSVFNDASSEVLPPYEGADGTIVGGAMIIRDSCVDTAGTEIAAADIQVSSQAQGIPAGVDAGFSVIVKAADGLLKGTYICTLGAHFQDSGSGWHDVTKQLLVVVK
jgi:hypothetical protein